LPRKLGAIMLSAYVLLNCTMRKQAPDAVDHTVAVINSLQAHCDLIIAVEILTPTLKSPLHVNDYRCRTLIRMLPARWRAELPRSKNNLMLVKCKVLTSDLFVGSMGRRFAEIPFSISLDDSFYSRDLHRFISYAEQLSKSPLIYTDPRLRNIDSLYTRAFDRKEISVTSASLRLGPRSSTFSDPRDIAIVMNTFRPMTHLLPGAGQLLELRVSYQEKSGAKTSTFDFRSGERLPPSSDGYEGAKIEDGISSVLKSLKAIGTSI
jgi:hypothetical protein